ncbi:hypothetical protein DQT32_04965 [Salmonella enterica subsp. enterica serovar Braenderup]|nr:hypothetical protein [Salmonella enterica subsp. enterica serovar Braenderup]
MFKRKKKINVLDIYRSNEELLVAYIMRGSSSSLFHYINTHKISANEARNDILRIKYLLSKCNSTVYNIIKKMVNEFDKFNIEQEEHFVFSDDDVITYDVYDTEHNLNLFCYDADISHPRTICMGVGGAHLTTDIISHKMFVYAIKCALYIQNNIKEFERDKEDRELKEEYIKAYG